MQLQEPYQKRPVRFLDVWQHNGWRLKVYGIAYQRDLPRPELVAAAHETAAWMLPEITADRYGVGFMGVHDGRGANIVFVDWWANENELFHNVYYSPPEAPRILRAARPGELTACTWDLAVMCYERTAWLETVLSNPAGPDFEAYLARRLDGEI